MSSDYSLNEGNPRCEILPSNGNPDALPLSEIPNHGGNGEKTNLNVSEKENIGTSSRDKNITIPSRTRLARVLHWVPKRYVVLAMYTMGYFTMYCLRMCLSVTIVAMTTGGWDKNQNETAATNSSIAEFDWSKELQGTILGCFYWGYTATQIPAGVLAFKYGGTFLFGFVVFGASVLTLLSPVIIRANVNIFIVLRIVEGLLLGFATASGQTIVSKWSPVYERSIFQTFGYSGFLLGTVFANSISGLLCDSAWRWPSVFYFFGILGIVWYLCWLYLIYENPSDNPNISEEELEKIGQHWHTEFLFRHIPWKQIIISLPFWSLTIAVFCECWALYTFMLTLPSYLNDVLKFDITKIGFVSSLPYVLSIIIAPSWGILVDILRRKKYISTVFARKLSAVIGMGVSALFIILISHATTSTVAMVMVTIAISITSITGSGPSVNLVDIAPKYAGILMGVVNFFCNITGFICPQIVGVITGTQTDVAKGWAIVFYITGSVELCGLMLFLCFASGEKQSWADQ